MDLCQAWRDRGLRIGFTNGCFDILHAGHVALLAKAAAKCDKLVVGLTSDSSVRRLKGPTRPVQGEFSRAQVLASLDAVDVVVIFEQDTPIELIERMRPDVLVKGADYSEDQVIGGDIVKAYGGQILLVDLVEGHSTTNALKRATARAG
ncbi:MAG: D-glycero-beta-D-manno-heptose 1-phosphate adenylyltransferase [Hyphomicrobiaceae bacterium]